MIEGQKYLITTKEGGLYLAEFKEYMQDKVVFSETIEKRLNTMTEYIGWTAKRLKLKRIIESFLDEEEYKKLSKIEVLRKMEVRIANSQN